MKQIFLTVLFIVVVAYFVTLWTGLNGQIDAWVALPMAIGAIVCMVVMCILADEWQSNKNKMNPLAAVYMFLSGLAAVLTFVAYVILRGALIITIPTDGFYVFLLGVCLVIQAVFGGIFAWAVANDK